MGFARWYDATAQQIVAISPGADKFAHSYAGLAIWVLAALALRTPRQSLLPLSVVIFAEAANEMLDRLAQGSWRWHDTLSDVAATLFWPLLLTALLRWTRWVQPGASGLERRRTGSEVPPVR